MTTSIAKEAGFLPECRRSFTSAALLLMLLPAFPAKASAGQEARTPMRAGEAKKVVEAPMKTAGIAYRSGGRRDPFLNPILLRKNAKPQDEELSRGTPPSGIAGTYIAQAVLQGTSIRDGRRIAIMRGADTRAYFLKEGDKLFDGYVKAIDTDSVTLVRVTAMKSGKTLTQDVTKRLRTP